MKRDEKNYRNGNITAKYRYAFCSKENEHSRTDSEPENLRLSYYLKGDSYPVNVDKSGKYSIELELNDFTIVELYPMAGYPSIVVDAKGSHLPVRGLPVYIEPGEQITVDFDLKEWPVAG